VWCPEHQGDPKPRGLSSGERESDPTQGQPLSQRLASHMNNNPFSGMDKITLVLINRKGN
jgi:hypothetical protein